MLIQIDQSQNDKYRMFHLHEISKVDLLLHNSIS